MRMISHLSQLRLAAVAAVLVGGAALSSAACSDEKTATPDAGGTAGSPGAGSPGAAGSAGSPGGGTDAGSLYTRLGGKPGISTFMTALLAESLKDPEIASYFYFQGQKPIPQGHPTTDQLYACLVNQLSNVTGGPEPYPGTPADTLGFQCRGMRESHATLRIPGAVFDKFIVIAASILKQKGVSDADIAVIGGALNATKADVAQDTTRDGGSFVPEHTVYAVDDNNGLVRFSTLSPGTVTVVAMTGVAGVHGIDFRPSTGALYALGGDGKIYIVDKATGAATVVGGDAGVATFAWTLDPAATSFGFDFNPAADRIRVHSNTGQNRRLHPADGLSVNAAGDGTLTYEDGGATAKIVGTAYTNSVEPKPAVTALYGIDAERDELTTFFGVSPDAGGVTGGFAGVRPVGPLGIDVQEVAGFDIKGGTNGGPDAGATAERPLEAFAALRVGGALGLYTVNITTGAARLQGSIGHARPLRGIAVQP